MKNIYGSGNIGYVKISTRVIGAERDSLIRLFKKMDAFVLDVKPQSHLVVRYCIDSPFFDYVSKYDTIPYYNISFEESNETFEVKKLNDEGYEEKFLAERKVSDKLRKSVIASNSILKAVLSSNKHIVSLLRQNGFDKSEVNKLERFSSYVEMVLEEQEKENE